MKIELNEPKKLLKLEHKAPESEGFSVRCKVPVDWFLEGGDIRFSWQTAEADESVRFDVPRDSDLRTRLNGFESLWLSFNLEYPQSDACLLVERLGTAEAEDDDETIVVEVSAGESTRDLSEPLDVQFAQLYILRNSLDSVKFLADVVGGSRRAYTPLSAACFSSEGIELVPAEEQAIDARFGGALLVEGAGNYLNSQEIDFNLSPQTKYVLISGKGYGERLSLASPLRLREGSLAAHEVRTFLDRAEESGSLVLWVESLGAFPVSSGDVRRTDLIKMLTDSGFIVLLASDTQPKREMPVGFSSNYMTVPIGDLDLIAGYFGHQGSGTRKVIVVSGLPTPRIVASATRLKLSGWEVVYEALDNFELIWRRFGMKIYSPALERNLLGLSDLVFARNHYLIKAIRNFAPWGLNAITVEQRPDKIALQEAIPNRKASTVVTRNHRPVLGYQVRACDNSGNYGILKTLATELPFLQIEIVGNIDSRQAKSFESLPNVRIFAELNTASALTRKMSEWRYGLVFVPKGAVSLASQYPEAQNYQINGIVPVINPKYSGTLPDFAIGYEGASDLVSKLDADIHREYSIDTIHDFEKLVSSFDLPVAGRESFLKFIEGKKR
ncbi:glycosyltransferase family 1 protein [Corynebacterium phocae]|uniref:glycosyltransferase family 1 protein n=1 Tax=Corynebacterium phocae TaxID=161895 RepID=UPI00123B3134|nr:glycosyltransferase family 1 protein [Corynebacterium phocae]KAA8726523.1 glycosyltransferase family 1 protein [Corynebacterium phocae]